MLSLLDAQATIRRSALADDALARTRRQNVLLVIDRSDGTEAAVQAVLARARGALHLIVLKLLPPWYSRRLEIGTRAHLARLALRLTSGTVQVTAEVRRGEPVTHVLAVAGEQRADVIAMPSHRRGLLDRLLDTTLASAVSRRASVPVEVLPKPLARTVPHLGPRLA
jgi:nucleotide-binding universal stress UspA family protein